MIIRTLQNLSLKNKFFFSTLAVILLVSLLIALFTRWVLISSLTLEIKRRGMGIAESIAENCRGPILTENRPALTSLAFDARLGERRQLVVYVYILDKERRVLAHSFTHPFPDGFEQANAVLPQQRSSIALLTLDGQTVYDVAVHITEGIYQIGTVHVGMNKNHIDQLIGKLRTMFLGFVSVVTIIFFAISHRLSRVITRPVSALTRMADEISRGNYGIRPEIGAEIAGAGAEVRQLADSFVKMTGRIQDSRKKLKESEAKYRSLVNSGPNPIFVVECTSLEILDTNPRAVETYGYSKNELIGRPLTDLGPLQTAGAGNPGGRCQERIVQSKVQFYKKDRSPLYVNVHACPARYLDRETFIVATTDISEIIEKDRQLIQASKMTTLGEMSAGIAHELNQPLNAIKMGSDYLEMMIAAARPVERRELGDIVREISRQVDRSAAIIKRLRDFGREADFTKHRVNLNEPVRGVLEILGRQLSLQNIQVRLDLDESIPPVSAHRNRLEQVVFNLITNARDALNQRTESGFEGERILRIDTRRDQDRAVLIVSDNGIGIPESLRERIFEAFFTTKQMGEGLGLGLSISYGIVKDYGGRIEIESREGRGTTFKLSFPTLADPDRSPPEFLDSSNSMDSV